MAICIGPAVQCPSCLSKTFGYWCNGCNAVVCSCEPCPCNNDN